MAALVAHMVKNPPAGVGGEMQVQSMSREDSLEEEMATDSSILVWRIPWKRGACGGYSPWGSKELDKTERLAHTHTHTHTCTHTRNLEK